MYLKAIALACYAQGPEVNPRNTKRHENSVLQLVSPHVDFRGLGYHHTHDWCVGKMWLGFTCRVHHEHSKSPQLKTGRTPCPFLCLFSGKFCVVHRGLAWAIMEFNEILDIFYVLNCYQLERCCFCQCMPYPCP